MIFLPSRFFSGRLAPVRYIVLHTTEGYDSRTWLTTTGNVSAHYLVRDDTYALVPEDYAAWHAGSIVGTPTTPYWTGINPNDESIGIEIEGFSGQLLPEDRLRMTADLIKDIRARRGPLPLVSHSELSPGNRSDPGAINREAIEKLLEADLAFKDDPDAQAYVKDVRNTFEAIKEVINGLAVQVPAIKAEAESAVARIDKIAAAAKA